MTGGFLISVGGQQDLESILQSGIYATLLNVKWNSTMDSTLGDYLTARAGDNIYFFRAHDRCIYGIGEIIAPFGSACAAFEVETGVTSTKFVPAAESTMKLDGKKGKEKTVSKRWGLAFKAAPQFFLAGIDMDDLLNSNPSAFRSLRVFWKRSFIHFDEEENRAFKSAIIRLNQAALAGGQRGDFFPSPAWHENSGLENFPATAKPLDLAPLLIEKRKRNGASNSEMTVECALLDALAKHEETAIDCFGAWDYLSHQVAASPFKPVDYMDRIDVFGYRWVPGYEHEVISKYLIVEIKKDAVDNCDDSQTRDYEQLMKYVDWVCEQYAHGDYSMIEAYLLASNFLPSVNEPQLASNMRDNIARAYVVGHSANTRQWDNVNLVKYRLTEEGAAVFEKVDRPF